MKLRIQKWGNTLVIEIPPEVVAEAHLREGAMLDFSVVEGKLTIESTPIIKPTLEETLTRIQEEDNYGEWNI